MVDSSEMRELRARARRHGYTMRQSGGEEYRLVPKGGDVFNSPYLPGFDDPNERVQIRSYSASPGVIRVHLDWLDGNTEAVAAYLAAQEAARQAKFERFCARGCQQCGGPPPAIMTRDNRYRAVTVTWSPDDGEDYGVWIHHECQDAWQEAGRRQYEAWAARRAAQLDPTRKDRST
jgi:hypothetical protein